MYSLISFKKSTPPQNRQFIVHCYFSGYWVDGSMGELASWNWLINALCQTSPQRRRFEDCWSHWIWHWMFTCWFCWMLTCWPCWMLTCRLCPAGDPKTAPRDVRFRQGLPTQGLPIVILLRLIERPNQTYYALSNPSLYKIGLLILIRSNWEACRGTSLIRKRHPRGPNRNSVPKVVGGFIGGGHLLWAR